MSSKYLPGSDDAFMNSEKQIQTTNRMGVDGPGAGGGEGEGNSKRRKWQQNRI